MKKRIIAWLAALLLLATLSSCSNEGDKKQPTPSDVPTADATPTQEAAQRNVLPAKFSAEDLNGKTYTESMFSAHQLTMINVWGTFCAPCVREMPHLGKIAAEYQEKGLQVIGIICDATDIYGNIDPNQVETAREIVEQTGANYPHLLPGTELNAFLSTVSAVPVTYFVDQNGNQVGEAKVGAMEYADWVALIDSLLSGAV